MGWMETVRPAWSDSTRYRAAGQSVESLSSVLSASSKSPLCFIG
jgi:hypothetical protein